MFTISKGIILQVQMNFQSVCEGEIWSLCHILFSVGSIEAVLLKQNKTHSQTKRVLFSKRDQKTSFTSTCLRKPL